MKKKIYFKKAFTLLEVIAVISIMSIFYSSFIIKFDIKDHKLEAITKRLILYLKQTRIQALIDEKFDPNNPLWHKKRWSLKFFRCKNEIGGIYYSIYSDTNFTGQVAKKESLKDPLTNKYIYSDNNCGYVEDRSKYVLLTKEYGVTNVVVSCNETDSLGQLSFGSSAELYSKLSNNNYEHYEHLVTKACEIALYNQKGDSTTIVIEPITGYIYRKSKI